MIHTHRSYNKMFHIPLGTRRSIAARRNVFALGPRSQQKNGTACWRGGNNVRIFLFSSNFLLFINRGDRPLIAHWKIQALRAKEPEN